MAGELSLLFRNPETCCLKGLHIQAHVWRHRPGRHYADVERYRPGRHYAALYFSGMEQTVADPQYHERWVCSDCVCHISLAADDELPDYNPCGEEELRRALQKWKRFHRRVEATLLYRDLEEWVNSEDRIVLDIIADGETVLSGLLNLLREIANRSWLPVVPAGVTATWSDKQCGVFALRPLASGMEYIHRVHT